MAFKLIEIATPEERLPAVLAIAEKWGAADIQVGAALGDGRRPVTLIVGDIDRQTLLDRLQSALGKSDNWRIAIVSADTVVTQAIEKEAESQPGKDETKEKDAKARASREELYNFVKEGVRLDGNFLLLVFLSTVVASVGLDQDNVAVLIGAMVIAPLLGPNIAFAFGAAIGDYDLMLAAGKSSAVGILLSVLFAGALALVIPANIASHEIAIRSLLDYADLALALASGAAAALSVTTGLSSTLVGVMVAVALLPPAATLGILVAGRRTDLAAGAAMLLVANVACVNLAAQLVFLAKGIRPRTWAERKNSRTAVTVNIVTWVALIALLTGAIAFRK